MEKEQSKCDHAEMEQEQSKRDHDRGRKCKQGDSASEESKIKEKESDRLRKKRCIQGESSKAKDPHCDPVFPSVICPSK